MKEINNVNSEISMRMTYNKNLAYYKILKTIGNPMSRLFQDGFANIDGSAIDVKELRTKLIDFHQQYYSSNLMTMTVISDDDFKDTRKMIESSFSEIENKKVEKSYFNTTQTYFVPLLPEVFKQVYYIQGFTEPSKLTLIFQTGSDLSNSKFHAMDFFSYFLNFFSENSFKQTLIKKDLITSFSDSISLQDYVNSIYTVSFTLTKNGLDNVTEILKEFFRFLKFVRELPEKQDIFNDLSKASKYSFLFGVKSEFMDFSQIEQNYFDRAVDFSETIQDFSPDMIFTAKNVMFQYNNTEFMSELEYLKPSNMFTIVESSKFKMQKKENGEIVKINGAKEGLKDRSLEQVQAQKFIGFVNEEHIDQTLGEFFNLKDKEFLKKHNSKNRILEEKPSLKSLANQKENSDISNKLNSESNEVQGVNLKLNEAHSKNIQKKEIVNLNLELNVVDNGNLKTTEINSELKKTETLQKVDIQADHLVKNSQKANSAEPIKKQLDKVYDRVLLDKSFDWDNGRMYTVESINEDYLLTFEVVESLKETEYETCQTFDTTHLDQYRMVTKCQPPPSLQTLVNSEHQSTEKVMEIVNNFLPDNQPTKGIRTEKLFTAIFNDGQTEMPIKDRYSVLRDLLIYKLCIIKEFDNDDKQINAKTLSVSSDLNVYHTLFRKTLQPKTVIIMTLESKSVLTAIKKSPNFESRVEKALLMEVLCMYIMRHVEFNNRDEFLKGNDVNCKAVNYRIILEFQGFTEQIEQFVSKTILSLKELTDSRFYREYILNNFRQRIVDIYSQFTSISSLKSSTFYLNLIMDKIFIDNSSPEKVEQIKELVLRISPERLSIEMTQLLSENKMFVLGVGNIDENTVSSIASRSRTEISIQKTQNEQAIDFNEFRRYMFDNFVTQINKDEHLMVRLLNIDKSESNSVYLTYFAIKRLTRTVKVHALIMNHFLKKLVYDHLRNNLNLGYVTQSGLKSYYHVN